MAKTKLLKNGTGNISPRIQNNVRRQRSKDYLKNMTKIQKHTINYVFIFPKNELEIQVYSFEKIGFQKHI